MQILNQTFVGVFGQAFALRLPFQPSDTTDVKLNADARSQCKTLAPVRYVPPPLPPGQTAMAGVSLSSIAR